ncbi:MAG: outer membrane porin, OprD family, partial [Campylobacterales bacterium]|nr:outer membrane porin, OprD family [Campylobacterales bacterium]
MKSFLSLATVTACLVSSSFAADSLEGMFKDGKANGELRAFYIDRNWGGTVGNPMVDRAAFAVGGNVGFDTASLHGLSLGAKFYTTNGLGVNSKTSAKVDGTLFDDNKDSYSILGESYLVYKNSNTTVKVGRQKLDTPLAGSDDARMLPNLFEATVLINTDIKDTTIIAAHVSKFAAGTFSNAYSASTPSNAALSVSSGYGLNQTSGKFMNMGTYAINQDTDGVSVLSA